jgi:hypothetical protein
MHFAPELGQLPQHDMNFMCQCDILLHPVSQQNSNDYCNRLIDDGFRLGKSWKSQTIPEDRPFFKLSIPDLRKQILQRDQNVEDATLNKLQSDWLRLSTDAGSHVMAPFLDFILINTHRSHASYEYMLHDSKKATEATAVFYSAATAHILEYLQTKGIKILSVVGYSLSSQSAALSDLDRS